MNKVTWQNKIEKVKESRFFALATEVEKEIANNKVTSTRIIEEIEVPSIYENILGKKQKIRVMKIGTTTVISSPEAEAISGAGALYDGKFRLPRFHMGVPAQLDMEVASFQLASTEEIKKILLKCKYKNSGIIYFAREGHLTEWQKAVFLVTNKSLPTTLINISHAPADNKFTRIASINTKPNLEGFNLNNLKYLFMCDPIASGMQHVAMLEKLDEMGVKLKNVIVIAPMSTRFGLRVIEKYCQEKDLNFYAGVCGTLLDTQAPLRYYSPYPRDINQVADPELHALIKDVFENGLHHACIRCNWTGTFWGGKKMPLSASNEELKEIGLSNTKLRTLSRKMHKILQDNPKLAERLTPYSSKAGNK